MKKRIFSLDEDRLYDAAREVIHMQQVVYNLTIASTIMMEGPVTSDITVEHDLEGESKSNIVIMEKFRALYPHDSL